MSHPRPRRPVSPPSTLASWPATIVRALDAHGVDGRATAAAAGLDPILLDDPEARVPSSVVMRFLDLAVAASGNPAFGLVSTRFVQQTTFYALGYAMLASGSLREAFERAIRYRRLIGELLELTLADRGRRTRLSIAFAGPPPVPDAVFDTAVSIALRTARLLRGDRLFAPVRVLLQRRRPADVEPFQRFFRAPVAFAQRVNALDFDRAIFDEPLPAGNRRLAEQSDEVIVRYLASLAPPSMAHRVQRALLATLPSGAPTKPQLAHHLGVSARTLQRQLADEGTTFAALLQATQYQLATAYLADDRISVKEVSFLVGFASRRAFTRAFKDWTGRPPSRGPAASRSGRRR